MARKLTRKESEEVQFTPIASGPRDLRERIAGAWSEFKWLFILGAAVLCGAIYFIFSIWGSHRPDLTVCVISSSGAVSREDCERLRAELNGCALDMNMDGAILTDFRSCLYSPQPPEPAEAAAAYDNYVSLVEGKKAFAFICDPASARHLTETGQYETLDQFSKRLPAGCGSVTIDASFPLFSGDPALRRDFEGWKLMLGGYSQGGYDRLRETRTEVKSARIFFEAIISELDLPDTEASQRGS